MFDNEAKSAGQLVGYAERKLDITIRQNIDQQIEQAEKRVEELKATKERMATSGILDQRIDDIQRAMRW